MWEQSQIHGIVPNSISRLKQKFVGLGITQALALSRQNSRRVSPVNPFTNHAHAYAHLHLHGGHPLNRCNLLSSAYTQSTYGHNLLQTKVSYRREGKLTRLIPLEAVDRRRSEALFIILNVRNFNHDLRIPQILIFLCSNLRLFG